MIARPRIPQHGKITGKNIQAKYEPPRTGDIRHSQADIALPEKMLGYKPLVHFEEGLQRTWAWYKTALQQVMKARASFSPKTAKTVEKPYQKGRDRTKGDWGRLCNFSCPRVIS